MKKINSRHINTFLKEKYYNLFRMLCISKKALIIIVLFASGMGGAFAVFQPIYSLIYAPLPFPQADRLVRIGGNIPIFSGRDSRFEKRELLDQIFSNLAAYAEQSDSRVSVKVFDTGKEVDLHGLMVTEEFFATMRIQPLKGSDFGQKESRNGMIISHRFWQREFMGVDNVIGKQLLLAN